MSDRKPDIERERVVSDYLKDMLRQLSRMARSQRFDFLAYLLEIAHEEADSIARGQQPTVMARPDPGVQGHRKAQ